MKLDFRGFLVGGTGRITIAWKHQTGRSLSQNSSPLVFHGTPWYPHYRSRAAGTAPLVRYGAAVAASEVTAVEKGRSKWEAKPSQTTLTAT